MQAVVVNNNKAELDAFCGQLQTAFGDCEIVRFTDPLMSAKYIWYHPVSIVFLEERMRPANGLDLLQVLRRQKPNLPIVLLAKDDYMREQAKNLAADGYWLRPVERAQLSGIFEMLDEKQEG